MNKILDDKRIEACYRLGCALLPVIFLGMYGGNLWFEAGCVLTGVVVIAMLILMFVKGGEDAGTKFLRVVNQLLGLPYAFLLIGIIAQSFTGTADWLIYGFAAGMAVVVALPALMKKD